MGHYNFFAGFENSVIFKYIVKKVCENTGCQASISRAMPGNETSYDILMLGPYSLPNLLQSRTTIKARVRIMIGCEELSRMGISDKIVKTVSDYAIGYVVSQTNRQFYIPNWYFYWDFFEPDSNGLKIVEQLSKPNWNENDNTINKMKKKWGSFIAKNPFGGTRSMLVKNLQSVIRVDCPGKVCNNMASVEVVTGIHNDGNRAKKVFLSDYVYNLCPENACISGYVTEKVIQASMAGCIPIYWGCITVESKILNTARILHCQSCCVVGDKTLAKIRDLQTNTKSFDYFFNQPVFLPGAVDEIMKKKKEFDEFIRQIQIRLD